MTVEIVTRQQVRLTGTTPSTLVWKAYRHLRTNIHWSKNVYGVKDVDNHTLELNGVWADLNEEVRHFSGYYPHVIFHVYETVEDQTHERRFLNGVEIS